MCTRNIITTTDCLRSGNLLSINDSTCAYGGPGKVVASPFDDLRCNASAHPTKGEEGASDGTRKVEKAD